MITKQSTLKLRQLNIKKDEINYIVEDDKYGEFYEMPQICIDAIYLMQESYTLIRIEKILMERYPEEEVDILSFTEQLLELELVEKIDDDFVHIEKKEERLSGFTWITPTFAKFFFNNSTLPILFSLFIINISIFVFRTDFIPNYRVIFIFDSIILSLSIYLGISLFLIILHELGHILAIRAQGLPTKLEIGNRLFIFIVLETDLTYAWKLNKKQRNILYLGGIYIEQVILFSVLLTKIFLPVEGIVDQLLFLAILDIIIKTIYQCCFYLRTDFYYIFENITGCYNIMEHSKNYLKNLLSLAYKKSTIEVHEREINIIRAYSIFQIVGIILTCFIMLKYGIPQTIYVYKILIPTLFNYNDSPYFWEAIFMLAQTLLVISLLIFTWIKSYKQTKKQ